MKPRNNSGPVSTATDASNLAEIKSICKAYGITNTVEYRERYKEIPGLPAHPERIFKDEWTSYIDLFDIPELIPYIDLKAAVQAAGIKSGKEYSAWLKREKNPSYPTAPEEAYPKDWENWYDFCGKERPNKTSYIPEEYQLWASKIDEFKKQADSGDKKASRLCRFVRFYIEKYEHSFSPHQLLTKERHNIKPFREEIKNFESSNQQRNMILTVNEFLDYIIDNDLTDEDEETGEVIRVRGAKNPFANLSVDDYDPPPTPDESTKPCLQYFFVRQASEWIIPPEAKSFDDLSHLQIFDADWVNIDREKVDLSDPDCVIQERGKKLFMWSPIDWIHTYALTKVPLRGFQLAYNDSGEGDHQLPVLNEAGSIVWVENSGALANTTESQSFVKKLADGQMGMFVTTNKTNRNNSAYTIPWIPEDLAYWIIRLRNWQSKYNTLDNPTPWETCRRTNLSELRLKSRGSNCFLFRAFGEFEPKSPSSVLTMRLAATLHTIQPKSLVLSELKGSPHKLSNYKSKYTPHSMRVSLITAYLMEMGMPVEIVMKIVGHSSIVMSIYYCKVTPNDIRKKIEEGEKKALKSQAQATQAAIEQNNIESVKNNLVASNETHLLSLTNDVPAGNYVFRDYGICPYAATRCHDGGDEINASGIHGPVPAGYLGTQNCTRCRHFITGPAFLGGLLTITEEILLEANIQSNTCSKLQEKSEDLSNKIYEIDQEEYAANAKQIPFDSSDRAELEFKLRKIESEYESAAMKADSLLCDLQASHKLLQLSKQVANREDNSEGMALALLKSPNGPIEIELEETSYFQQLQEVCENATIFECSNPSRAIAPRSQLLDKMAMFNDLAPSLLTLSEEQQLVAGNEIVKLLKSRLKTWNKVDELIEGKIKLVDLLGEEKIERSEITVITSSKIDSQAFIEHVS